MCRLFAIRANRPVDIEFSLLSGPQNFKKHGVKNPDGWGIGWFEDGKPQVKKEKISIRDSNEVESVVARVRSEIVISHVRKATPGYEVHVVNCHPFQSGRWLFAHNGRVDREALVSRLDDRHRSTIQGTADSEVYFQWLLQNIEQEGSVQKGLVAALRHVRNSRYSGLNFILADGTSVYAYRDASKDEAYYSLFYLCRDPQTSGPAEFRSKELAVLLQSKALNGEKAVVICSETLTEEAWKEIPIGGLLSVSEDLIPRLVEVQ